MHEDRNTPDRPADHADQRRQRGRIDHPATFSYLVPVVGDRRRAFRCPDCPPGDAGVHLALRGIVGEDGVLRCAEHAPDDTDRVRCPGCTDGVPRDQFDDERGYCTDCADVLFRPKPRTCEMCGDALRPGSRSDARLCSARCRKAAQRQREQDRNDTGPHGPEKNTHEETT